MTRVTMLVLVCLSVLVPTEARANDGGWWDWLWKWDAKMVGYTSEIHLYCMDENGNRVKGCEEFYRKLFKTDHKFTVLGDSNKTYSVIKHEFDFRFGIYSNYGKRYDRPDPPIEGTIYAWKLMGAYVYHLNDCIAVGGGYGGLIIGGDRFDAFGRQLVMGDLYVYPFSKGKLRALGIRPTFNWIPKGFTGAEFGDPGVTYSKGNVWFPSIAIGVDVRRISR